MRIGTYTREQLHTILVKYYINYLDAQRQRCVKFCSRVYCVAIVRWNGNVYILSQDGTC